MTNTSFGKLFLRGRFIADTALTLAALFMLAAAPAHAAISVSSLRCESRHEPLGVDAAQPRLSWIIDSGERDQRQAAYRVLVAASEKSLAAGLGDLWDSGKVAGSETVGIDYAGLPLRTGQRCYWKVQAWDQKDRPSRWSPSTWWEMGLLAPADWTGQWLNDGKLNPTNDADFYRDDPAPLFRRELKLSKPIRRARLHISGLGYYEASLNGQRVGDNVLDPGWTMYGQRVYYSTYDVTGQLRPGDNCLGVTLGNGWWNPLPLQLWGQRNFRQELAVGRPRFIAQLNVEFTDGTRQSFASDAAWKVADGPLRRNSIYLGEVYDARQEVPGWNQPGFDDSAWRPAKFASEAIGQLQAQPQPPIRVRETFPAARVTKPQPGVFIYDLGQNFSGWASFHFRAPAGTRIVLRYGELLNPDGSLNPLTSVCGQIKGTRKNQVGREESVGGPGAPAIAWQADTYIARGGGEESYVPRFTFHGFRYVEVTGLVQALPLEAVTGMRLSADVPEAGEFSCSNPLFNEIQAMCRRTFLANLFSVQSDCPHRERLGYGGDIAATSEALMLNFDMENFYTKVVADFADSARPDGMLTDTAPFVGIQYCGVGWAMAHPLLAAQLYRYYGNRRVMEEQYATARRWLLLVAKQYPDGIVTEGLSDHESLAPTSAPPFVTPLFYQSAELVAGLARTLGHREDAAQFAALADKIRQAYQQRFFDTGTGRAGPGTQGSQAFALYSDLVPAGARSRALDVLLENIHGERKGHLSTGILGTKFMLEELSREGHADVACGLVQQTDFPGWGWMLANGATTLWEHWELSDNTYSHSHPMFGSVSQWFIRWLGGIQPQPEAIGFDRILIRPQAVPGLKWVKSSYNSVRGRIVSNWSRDGDRLSLELVVPANTTATVFVPAQAAARVTESGKPVGQTKGVKFLRMENHAAVYEVGSGTYRFQSALPEDPPVKP
jgi:alpha-L-rhamnosidase